jgi:hypothetical protein
MSTVPQPAVPPVQLTVDEVTVILGLLGVLCDEHEDDDVAGVARRTVGRLRELLASLTTTPPGVGAA